MLVAAETGDWWIRVFICVNCQVVSGLLEDGHILLLILVHSHDRANHRHGPHQSVLHGIHPCVLHLSVVRWRHAAQAGSEAAEYVDWTARILLPGHHGQMRTTGKTETPYTEGRQSAPLKNPFQDHISFSHSFITIYKAHYMSAMPNWRCWISLILGVKLMSDKR